MPRRATAAKGKKPRGPRRTYEPALGPSETYNIVIAPGFARERYEAWAIENNASVADHPELNPHYERERREELEREQSHENRIRDLRRRGGKHKKKPEIVNESTDDREDFTHPRFHLADFIEAQPRKWGPIVDASEHPREIEKFLERQIQRFRKSYKFLKSYPIEDFESELTLDERIPDDYVERENYLHKKKLIEEIIIPELYDGSYRRLETEKDLEPTFTSRYFRPTKFLLNRVYLTESGETTWDELPFTRSHDKKCNCEGEISDWGIRICERNGKPIVNPDHYQLLLDLVWERLSNDRKGGANFVEFKRERRQTEFWKDSNGDILAGAYVTWIDLELPCQGHGIIHLSEPNARGVREIIECPTDVD